MCLFMSHQHNVRKLITELLGVAVLSLDKCRSEVSLHPQQSHPIYSSLSVCASIAAGEVKSSYASKSDRLSVCYHSSAGKK